MTHREKNCPSSTNIVIICSPDPKYYINEEIHAQGILMTRIFRRLSPRLLSGKWTKRPKRVWKSIVRPSSRAQETRGVHPILLAIMWKINSILKGTAHLTSEQYQPNQQEKSKRWMDALLTKFVQHFLSRANGNMIEKSFEFKPILRKGIPYQKMVDDGLNQELGHNLQMLWDSCYQFCGGLSRNGETFGIVLTMISASLLRSKLTGVGTDNVNLEIRRKTNMPLF